MTWTRLYVTNPNSASILISFILNSKTPRGALMQWLQHDREDKDKKAVSLLH